MLVQLPTPTHLPHTHPMQVRTLVQREMGAALACCDVLLCPAAPGVAYRLGEKSTDPLAMYKGDVMTVNVNLAGLPAVCLPAGTAPVEGGGSMPVGVQLVGRPFGEAELLGIAHALECAIGFERLALVAVAAPSVAAPAAAAAAAPA